MIKKNILYTLGFINVLPVNLLFFLFWLLPQILMKTFERIEWDWNIWAWKCDVDNQSKFYKKYMFKWWGFVVGSFIIYCDDDPLDPSHIKHEATHVIQNYIFGILFYPIYELIGLGIYLFGSEETHPYYDNPFEVWARRKAGQQLKIPKTEWYDGPNDRWIWW